MHGLQLFSPFSDQSEHTFQTSSSWAKKGQITEVTLVGRGLVVNFTQRIVQNWNLMRRFLVTIFVTIRSCLDYFKTIRIDFGTIWD